MDDEQYEELADVITDWAIDNLDHLDTFEKCSIFGHHMADHARILVGDEES